MQDYQEISSLIEKVIHKYVQVEKKKRLYGTDILLSRTEIHTIVEIGKEPGINVTTLANYRGITKGAASQMIYKLIEKGLVIKSVSPNSDSEVCLHLTDKGQEAYNGHMEYHQSNSTRFFKALRELSPEQLKQATNFLQSWDKYLDESLHDQ